MIRIEKTEVVGWEHAIRGMRNPMNSWDNSDSTWFVEESAINPELVFDVGPNDMGLMQKLYKAGTDHRKFMRMIVVYCDITAPLYWWKEFDTYKVGTVANSCSTMHKIHSKALTLDDFSHDRMRMSCVDYLQEIIGVLNSIRLCYMATNDKSYWDSMIQLLPSSYNQKRTVMMNYEVLASIYNARKNHKLDEWRELCSWIESLPYSFLMTGKDGEPDG